MNKYKVLFYTTHRGQSPIDEFLNRLDNPKRAKVEAYIALLQEKGPNLHRPYADHVRGKIRELRPGNIRVLYCFFLKNYILLLLAIKKKVFRLLNRDIKQAERNMNDYIARYEKGEIVL